jgi:hypothetical protein
MPEPVEPSPLTDHEEAKWRAEFKRRGREVVYEQARRDQFNPESASPTNGFGNKRQRQNGGSGRRSGLRLPRW